MLYHSELAGSAVRPHAAAPRFPAVAQGHTPGILRTIGQPTIGLALWHRPARAALRRPVAALCALPPFSHTAEGHAPAAMQALLAGLPAAARGLGPDIALLARLFAVVTGGAVRLRLEHVADDACRRHHVDAVRLRLLCTYAGPGTEWIGAGGVTHRMPAMQVAVLKGTIFPDAAPRVLHRSPPVSHLPADRRSRLLLCIDEAGVF